MTPETIYTDGHGQGLVRLGWERYQSDYADYLKRIEQYKGTPFYQQLLDNPYYQYQEYSPGAFEDSWYAMTGSRRHLDDFYNSRKTSGDEYFSEVLDAMRQQNYDDPSAEVARRKAAGLNDDLNGGSQIGSGTAGEARPDDTPPITGSTAPDDGDILTKVADFGFSVFTHGMSLVSFFQDFQGKSIANAANDLSLADQAYDWAIKQMAGSSSLPTSREEYDALSEKDKQGIDDQLFKQLDASVKAGHYKGMFATRRAKQIVNLMRGVVSYDKDGKPTLAYEAYRSKLLAQRYGDHKAAAEAIGTPGFSENVLEFANKWGDIFGKCYLAIQKAMQRIQEANARSAEAQANYDQSALTSERGAADAAAGIAVDQYKQSAYTSERGAADAAAGIAEDSARQVQAENAKIISDLRKEVNEYLDSFRKFADEKGGVTGMLIKLMLPSIYSNLESIYQQGLSGTVWNRGGLGNIVELGGMFMP